MFWVMESSRRSRSWGSVSSNARPGSEGTFSMMVPAIESADAMIGSASLSRSMSFA